MSIRPSVNILPQPHGAALSIHHGDRAGIERVLYRDIRIDHPYEKLFSLRISKSRSRFEADYGHMRDIEFRDLTIIENTFNPGYTCSLLGGHDDSHRIIDLRFVNVRIGSRVLRSLDDFACYHQHVHHVEFSPTTEPPSKTEATLTQGPVGNDARLHQVI